MLNPSTADEVVNDPTIRRCMAFASTWGYGSLEVCNLFGWRTKNPSALGNVDDPVGSDNDRHIMHAANRADRIVAAWGNHGQRSGRSGEVRLLLSGSMVFCLGLTSLGAPKHPLYVPSAQKPVQYLLRGVD